MLEINFRALGVWLNETFGQPAYTPPYVPFALPRFWRGQGDLLPILNANWRYVTGYINAFVEVEPTLAGVSGFAGWPPFRGVDEKEVGLVVAKNWIKLVNYINNDVAPLL